MKNRISSIMDTRKKRTGAIVLSLVLIATLCTGFAFAANALAADSHDGDSGKTYQLQRSGRFTINGDGSITPANDEKLDGILDSYNVPPFSLTPNDKPKEDAAISDGITLTGCNDEQARNMSGQQIQRPITFNINGDGSVTPAKNDDKVDSLFDSFNIPQSETRSGDVVLSTNTTFTDCVIGSNPASRDSDLAPPTYTDAEKAQMIDDIESGKIQPFGKFNNDGTIEIYNLPEGLPVGAEIDVSLFSVSGCSVIGE